MPEDRSIDPDLLPEADERAWVVNGLAALVQRAGWGPLLRAPWIEAKAEFFPDPWEASKAGIRRWMARVLVYVEAAEVAGNPPPPTIKVHVQPREIEHRDPERERPDGPNGRTIDAWLVDNRADHVEIAVERAALEDPLRLIAALCRVAGHRFCLAHGRVRALHEHFNPTIDLAAVYLGFGVPLLDAADHRRSPAPGQKPERTRQGAASLEVLAFAMAMVARARGYGASGQRQIAKAVALNQGAFFQMACRALELDDSELRKLDVPAKHDWPKPRSLPAILAYELPPQAADDPEQRDADADALPEERGIVGANRGKPVFCVDRSIAKRVFKFAMGLGFFAGMATRSVPDLELDTGLLIAYGVSGVALATLIGTFIRERRCSEPKCDAKLAKSAQQCPRCGGDIRGVIHHPNQRLEMEEKFLREA